MQIITMRLSDLNPYKNNAKEHPREQIEQIKESITKFGNNDPISVWSDENIIVEGHGRYKALRELGYDEVPCIRLDHLTDEERKAYTLVHNKLTMNSDFDEDILSLEMDELKEFFDMTVFGFEDTEFEEVEEEEIEPDVEFTKSLEEKHNYIVLYFDNEIDWLQAQSVFDIKRVKEFSTRKDGAMPKTPRYGVGRVLHGGTALARLIGVNMNEDKYKLSELQQTES